MSVRKTNSGWVMETTNRKNDCLEQGGIHGREVLYKPELLGKLGIDPNADPAASAGCNDPSLTWEDVLRHAVRESDVPLGRVIRKGEVIS